MMFRELSAWLFGTLFFGLFVPTSFAAVSRVTNKDLWNEVATARPLASQAIDQCLDRASRTPDMLPVFCVRAAYRACEAEHGNMSQRDLNDCATFSHAAWEERRMAVKKRLIAAKQAGSVFPSPDRHIALLVESERRWEVWNGPDCEMQAAVSKGGTHHRFALELCLSNHAAYRAIEFEALAEDWGKIFNLDN